MVQKKNYSSDFIRIAKNIKESSDQDISKRIRVLDNFATIGSFFTTLILGLVTLCLTQKYGESTEQIKLLSSQVEILKTAFDPYVDGQILEISRKNNYTLTLIFQLENLGGNLKELELICKNEDSLCSSLKKMLKPTMGKNSKIKGQMNFSITDDLTSRYTFSYKNMMGEKYSQGFEILHDDTEGILKFIFQIPEKKTDKSISPSFK